jgi:ParB-like chromosome segregation protein Spo0J
VATRKRATKCRAKSAATPAVPCQEAGPAIAESIRTFGFVAPILVDRDGNVIAGHGRLAACRTLGITELPTLCLDHLTPRQARAFMIADNRLAEIAIWDDRLLAEQPKELALIGLDFNIEVIGFEIDLRIASLDDLPEPDDLADMVPAVPAGPPLSKIGDLWFLGR